MQDLLNQPAAILIKNMMQLSVLSVQKLVEFADGMGEDESPTGTKVIDYGALLGLDAAKK